MTEEERPQFFGQLKSMLAAMAPGKFLGQDLLDGWWLALHDCTLRECTIAVERLARGDKVPVPSDARRIIQGERAKPIPYERLTIRPVSPPCVCAEHPWHCWVMERAKTFTPEERVAWEREAGALIRQGWSPQAAEVGAYGVVGMMRKGGGRQLALDVQRLAGGTVRDDREPDRRGQEWAQGYD
jgi:hypothetical protein